MTSHLEYGKRNADNWNVLFVIMHQGKPPSLHLMNVKRVKVKFIKTKIQVYHNLASSARSNSNGKNEEG